MADLTRLSRVYLTAWERVVDTDAADKIDIGCEKGERDGRERIWI
jgi:hypothetical protein